MASQSSNAARRRPVEDGMSGVAGPGFAKNSGRSRKEGMSGSVVPITRSGNPGMRKQWFYLGLWTVEIVKW